jgi:glycosyltransferase involved in cell wall biosynthesis
MTENKVLIICFEFPPTHMIGALRPSKWAKYLPEYGWEVHVLTVKNIFGNRADFSEEFTREDVIRTNFIDFWKIYSKFRKFFCRSRKKSDPENSALIETRGRSTHFSISSTSRLPDRAIGWVPFAIRRGIKEIKKQEICLLISTSGPPTNHIIAWILHKVTGKPWIADYRDPWTTNPFTNQIRIIDFFEKSIEKNIIKDATLITTVSRGYAKNLSNLHKRKVDIIYNGFDLDDLSDIDTRSKNDNKFFLTYTGTLSKEYRNPSALFEAIGNLLKSDLLCAKNFQITFLGQEESWIDEMASMYGIEEVFVNGGIVSRKTSLEYQANSTAMLIIDNFTGCGSGQNLPTKIFDYVSSKHRILALAPHDSEIAAFLEETNSGIVCLQVGEIEMVLRQWMKEYLDTGSLSYCGNVTQINKYSRRNQSKEFSNLLSRALP